MYSIQGVPLDNTAFGWRLMQPTKPIGELTVDRTDVRTAGRDGVAAGIPADTGSPVLPFVVKSPRENVEALIALFSVVGAEVSLTADASKTAGIELASFTYDAYGPAEEIVVVKFLVRFPSVWWRGGYEVTGPTNVSASFVLALFAGLSAPVQDLLIRVDGSTSGLRLTDSDGSWLSLTTSAAGEHVLIAPAQAKAVLASAGSWSLSGTDVSDRIDFGGPRSVFEVTPTFTDPKTRSGQVTVNATSWSSATVTVRGKGAHVA